MSPVLLCCAFMPWTFFCFLLMLKMKILPGYLNKLSLPDVWTKKDNNSLSKSEINFCAWLFELFTSPNEKRFCSQLKPTFRQTENTLLPPPLWIIPKDTTKKHNRFSQFASNNVAEAKTANGNLVCPFPWLSRRRAVIFLSEMWNICCFLIRASRKSKNKRDLKTKLNVTC